MIPETMAPAPEVSPNSRKLLEIIGKPKTNLFHHSFVRIHGTCWFFANMSNNL